MKAIKIRYSYEDNQFTEIIVGKDLEEEIEIYSMIIVTNEDRAAIPFATWWRPAKYVYSELQLMPLEDHGIVGWVELMLDNPVCPDWMLNNDFKVEVSTES